MVSAAVQLAGANESRHATARELGDAGLPTDVPTLFHAAGGWVKPGQLVRAWLGQPGVRLLTGARVASIEPMYGAAHDMPDPDAAGDASGNDPASEDVDQSGQLTGAGEGAPFVQVGEQVAGGGQLVLLQVGGV